MADVSTTAVTPVATPVMAPAGPATNGDVPQMVTTDVAPLAVTTAPAEHIGPTFLTFGPGAWVGVSMLVFLIILIWKGVHKAIGGSLDTRIAAIREQLDEARSLRAEAEKLREDYVAKIANAEKDAAAMLEHARAEAAAIVANAETESEALIVRRERMAEDKIAAAERSAIEELRAKAAAAAAAAARRLIAENYEAAADRQLVDQAIASM